MPMYLVRLRVNVPSLGERIVPFPQIAAATIEDAIAQARAMVIVEATSAEKTADA